MEMKKLEGKRIGTIFEFAARSAGGDDVGYVEDDKTGEVYGLVARVLPDSERSGLQNGMKLAFTLATDGTSTFIDRAELVNKTYIVSARGVPVDIMKDRIQAVVNVEGGTINTVLKSIRQYVVTTTESGRSALEKIDGVKHVHENERRWVPRPLPKV